ncbi:hypothetical protein BD413DRAFT_233635 [Trametes elegans]|nr:hypothetical protein BD413DRAFT_233635 [Trametes elegans]
MTFFDDPSWGADNPGWNLPARPARSPPRAPRAMLPIRDNRSVTPPSPRAPSPTYLALSEQPPSRADDQAVSKKLLVLDLNGTLLHRAPHTVGRPKNRHQQPNLRDEQGGWLPRLRPVHPRPYMGAFRSYLFAPQTRAWLDVMVWSSAQPHSVGDMVDKCFGEYKDLLLAIWARDTLGLSEDHYHRKVQTVKDLEKPWSLLAPPSAHIPSSPHSSIASTPRTSPEPSSPSRPSDESAPSTLPQAHSALTTLLLDDSPRKAELQPYNHVCIPEYTGQRRAEDLDSITKEKEWAVFREARRQLDARLAEGEGSAAAPEDSPETEAPVLTDGPEAIPGSASSETTLWEVAPPVELEKKRKRKERKMRRKHAAALEKASGEPPGVSYDETLLAVVGVLDEIKTQANVAAWIRSGGLWGPYGPPDPRPATEVTANGGAPAASSSSSSVATRETSGTQSDDSDLSVENAPSAPLASATQHEEQSGRPRRRKNKRQRMRDASAGQQPGEGTDGDVGNDRETVAQSSSGRLNNARRWGSSRNSLCGSRIRQCCNTGPNAGEER